MASDASLILYHGAPSRSSIVHWMLEEIGQPYQLKVLSLQDGEQRRADYLAINPMGKVPTLVHDGVAITEAAAICCYLADAFPESGLAVPVGDRKRGPYLKWLFFGPSCFEPVLTDRMLQRPEAPRGTTGWGDYDTVMAVIENALEVGPYLMGERFTAADVVIGSGLRWAMHFKGIPERPAFTRYVARLGERPALQRAIEQDQALQTG